MLPLWSALSLLSTGAAVLAAPVVFESGEGAVALVELYTSEGCSSCPPADVWMSGLKTNPGLWKSFVPVAFHVDYWDRLGWADRFASHANTERQSRYAAAWRSGSVYTPGMVLNGREWRDWRGVSEPPAGRAKIGVLQLTLRDGAAEVTFTPTISLESAPMVEVALLGMDLGSNVKGGENSGRRLRHDFVALGIVSGALKKEGVRYVGGLALPATGEAPKAVAAWVRMGPGEAPFQAVGGWLGATR